MEVCMYKGYIRNRLQLCRELGIDPSGERGDVEREILLRGCRRWGRELPGRLYGSFAFAVRDKENGELLCARDPFGIESFYYCLTGDGRLLYAPRLDPIVGSEGLDAELDPEALQLYMIFGYPIGEKTLYRGVKKLLPGRVLTFRNGRFDIETYYAPRPHPEADCQEEEWTRRIDETLQTILAEDGENFDLSVCRAFLSGGVDSSYLLAASGVKDACGVGYAEERWSETHAAAETARLLGAHFREIRVGAEDYFAALPGFLNSAELPLADPACVALSVACGKIAEETRLCMSGEGADEFFAGYHVYRRAQELGGPDGERYYGCDGVMDAEAARLLLRQERRVPLEGIVREVYKRAGDCDPLERMLAVDVALWLEGDILFGVGRAAGPNGLTVLMPYADRRMFELAARIPAALKRKDGCGKYILRRAAEKRLPHETAFREKVGFSVPVREWMADPSRRADVEAVLFGESSDAFFDQAQLRGYWNSFCAGSATDFRIVWAAYVFLVWHSEVFRKERGGAVDEEAYREWKQAAPGLNVAEAWPAEQFPEATWHLFREAGCLVTSLAIMLRRFGVERESDPARFDPWIFNERLKAAGAFTPAADLVVSALDRLYPIEYVGSFPYSREALVRLWEEGDPFLITVPGVRGARHFIVPDGLTDDDMKLIDPAWGKQYLSQFETVCELRVFRRSASEPGEGSPERKKECS